MPKYKLRGVPVFAFSFPGGRFNPCSPSVMPLLPPRSFVGLSVVSPSVWLDRFLGNHIYLQYSASNRDLHERLFSFYFVIGVARRFFGDCESTTAQPSSA